MGKGPPAALGMLEEALASWANILDVESDNEIVLSINSRTLETLSNLKRLDERLKRSVELHPNNFAAVVLRSEFLLIANRWNEGAGLMIYTLTKFKESNKTYPGDVEIVLSILLIQDSSQWQTRITDLISWFEPFPTVVTNGLVSSCKQLISPLISDTIANLWHDTWHKLTHHLPEYQLPLRLLTTALHYKQKPDDPRVWMELSIEERKILQQALGIDSIELCD